MFEIVLFFKVCIVIYIYHLFTRALNRRLQDAKKVLKIIIMKYLDRKLIERVDKMLAEDIAKLMSLVPLEEQISKTEGSDRSVLFTYTYLLPWLKSRVQI